ncbi:hypothetical protein AGMMS50249_4480 [candidate division SR1 bacterium]|nr:hypothetical protein AGMMS50249_4480 [candidate division SR1 bacterium]
MPIDKIQQHLFLQNPQTPKSALGFFSKAKEADIAYQLSNSPIKLPKSSTQPKEKTPSEKELKKLTFQQRVPIIHEGPDPIKSLNAWLKKLENNGEKRVKYSDRYFSALQNHKNKGTDPSEYASYELAVQAFKVYQEKIHQRQENLAKEIGYSSGEGLNQDIKLFNNYQDSIKTKFSPGKQMLDRLRGDKLTGNSIKSSLQTMNEVLKIKTTDFTRLFKYFELHKKDNLDQYFASIEQLKTELSERQSTRQLRQEFSQKKIDQEWNETSERLKPRKNLINTVQSGLFEITMGVYTTVQMVNHTVLSKFTDDNWQQRSDQIENWRNYLVPQVSTQQSSSILANPNSYNIIYHVGKQVINMLVGLGGGASILSKAGMSGNAGLVSASFIQMVGNTFDEAKNQGLSDNKALLYATSLAGIQSILELVSPELPLKLGKILRKELPQVILKENAQELLQQLTEKLQNAITNKMRDTQFDGDMTRREDWVETVILTTLTTGLVSGGGVRTSKVNQEKKAVFKSDLKDQAQVSEEKKETTDKTGHITYEELLQLLDERMKNPTDESEQSTDEAEQPIDMQEIIDAIKKPTVKHLDDIQQKEEVYYTADDLEWFNAHVVLTDKWLRIGDIMIDRDFNPQESFPDGKYINMYDNWYSTYEGDSFSGVSQVDTKYATLVSVFEKIGFPTGYVNESGQLCDEDSYYITLPLTSDKGYITLIIDKFGGYFSSITGGGTIMTPLVHVQMLNDLRLGEITVMNVENSKIMDEGNIEEIRKAINQQSQEKLVKKAEFNR